MYFLGEEMPPEAMTNMSHVSAEVHQAVAASGIVGGPLQIKPSWMTTPFRWPREQLFGTDLLDINKIPLFPGGVPGLKLSWPLHPQEKAREWTLALMAHFKRKRRPLCLLGDSHMRHLHNSFQELRGLPCYSLNKNVCRMPPLLYEVVTWGRQDRLRSFRHRDTVRDCGAIVVNFGQWALGWHEGFPEAVDVYSHNVINFLTFLLDVAAASDDHLPVFWASITAYQYSQPLPCNSEWRMEPNIALYNAANRRMVDLVNRRRRREVGAGAQQVKYIDLYHISSIAVDMVYDQHHYKDQVGRALASTVVFALLRDFADVLDLEHD